MRILVNGRCLAVVFLCFQHSLHGSVPLEQGRVDEIVTTTERIVRSPNPRAPRISQTNPPHDQIRISGATVAPRDAVYRQLNVNTLIVEKQITVTDIKLTGTIVVGSVVSTGPISGPSITINGPANVQNINVAGTTTSTNIAGTNLTITNNTNLNNANINHATINTLDVLNTLTVKDLFVTGTQHIGFGVLDNLSVIGTTTTKNLNVTNIATINTLDVVGSATVHGSLTVAEPIFGNLIGNVTGNVTGNLVGNVFGNVIGNVSGASSLNVLKAGDTMTGQLRVSTGVVEPAAIFTGQNTTAAPALQLLQNPLSVGTDTILAIDSSGNVTRSTISLGSILSGGTSGNVPNTLVLRDGSGNFAAGIITADFIGNVLGDLTGNVVGNVSGAASANVLKSGDTMFGPLNMGGNNIINVAYANITTLDVTSTLTVKDLYITGTEHIEFGVVDNLSVVGTTTTKNLTVTNHATINALDVVGSATVNGTLTVVGPVFGNVVGNVSGASSLNVLKAGDTMTGQLRVSTQAIEPAVIITGQGTTAAALRLLNNQPALGTDTIVGMDPLGNITQSTIPIDTISGGTSGNVPNTLVLRDGSGNFAASIISADLSGNVFGNIIGNISGAASLNVLKSGDAMSGTLNMTTNNIINVGTVNGVTVQAHASRHIPGGADPLPVATPVTLQTINFEGTANSFSRSDHVHAHGSQADPTLHDLATDTLAGFMAPEDKSMLLNATSGSVPGTLVLRNDTGSFEANAAYLQGLDVVGTSTFRSAVYNLFANVSPNNVLYVQKGQIRAPNEFNSVKAAVDSITDSSATNLYVVAVGPGVYGEDPITLKPYICVRGASEGTSIIQANNPNADLITAVDQTYMRNLTLKGASGAGYAAVAVDGGIITMQFINFDACDIFLKVRATTQPTSVSVVTAGVPDTAVFSSFADIQSNMGLPIYPCVLSVTGVVWTPSSSMAPGLTAFNVAGPGAVLSATTLGFGTPIISPTPGSGTKFLQLSNGATVQLASSLYQGFDIGVSVPAGLIGPNLNLLSVVAGNNNTDVSIQDQQTSGSISGEFTKDKVVVDSAVTGLSLSIMEPTSGGVAMVGPLFTGRSIGTITNISPLVNEGASLGTIGHSLLYTTTASLVVTVSAGSGYLMNTPILMTPNPIDNLALVTWLTTTTIVLPNQDNFLYIDNAGQLRASLSQPSSFMTIPLGKVRTDASGALFIEQINQDANHTVTQLTGSFIEALGPIYVTGSTVSKNGDDGLTVTAGQYVYGTHTFAPVGASSLLWQAYLGAGTNEFLITQTAIDWQHFDNEGTLDLIPTGSYAKHLLYVIGGADVISGAMNEQYALVYSQTFFSSPAAAVSGPVPTPPATWSGNIVQVASIVVQNNPGTPSARITQILDQRPRIGFVPSSVAGVTVHGNLLGLLADDHPQYLLVSGSRAMSGPLNMGTNQITNAGNINGVTIQTHASRHLPGSLLQDPLPMGVPVTIGTVNSLSQSGGVVNNFAYSDHVHAHGAQTDATLHALATTSAAGFMSSTDKQALTNATPSNTPSTLVERDASGNFAANTIMANLVGDVSGNISSSTVIVDSGTAAAPSVTFTGNTDTGMFSPGTSQVALTTAGTERFTVGATGTVTIAGLNSAGVVHTDGSGNLSTSLIVNNDITNGTIANNKLATATSLNTPNYLVVRDAQGSFAAGVITATGGFIGNLTGNVVGNVFGDVTGNVHGNVVGNLQGDVTGNVTGNLVGNVLGDVTGAASLNVLKAGDTMTGELRVSDATNSALVLSKNTTAATAVITGNSLTQAPALRLFGNPTATGQDVILTIDSSGNVTESTATIGSLTGGTSGNQPNTLVLRDAQGSFAAGVITATGGFIGNLTGNVVGNVLGDVTGNVHGNVVGNLQGDVTGNVTGNLVGNVLGDVTGAASLNVLKAGDTMTGELRVSDATNSALVLSKNTTAATAVITGNSSTQAPALRLFGNPTATGQDVILTIDSSGNVTESTATIGSLTGGTSGNQPNTLVLRDAQGSFAAGVITATGGFIGNLTGNVAGNVLGDVTGNVHGNVVGNLQGDVTGNVTGNLVGNVLGDVTGNVSGLVTGGLQGNVTGNVYGNVQGNVVGNVFGDVTGNVVGNVSGAASENVLKTGDTMTGQLRISDPSVAAAVLRGLGSTVAPALQLQNNPVATNSDTFLAVDGLGNVTQSNVAVETLTNATSGNVPNTLVLRDGVGNFAANAVRAQGLDVVGTSTFNSQVYNFFATVSPNNVLYVHKGPITAPNEFNSIKAAVDSIAGSSATNRFAVTVAPGVYVENTITMQPYVGIIGINESAVIIQAATTSQDIIIGADNAFLKGLTIQGATDAGMAAISIDGGTMGADNINFGSSDILMKIRATTAPGGSTITLTNVLETGAFTTAFDIQSNDFPSPIYPCGLTFSSLTWSPSIPMASTVTFAKVHGPGSYLVGASLGVGSFAISPTVGTKFLELFNGGFVEIASASVSGFDTAFSMPAGTTGSTINLLAIVALNNNTDISVQDQAVSGSISGEFNRNKINIDPAATGLAFFFTDGGVTSVGSLYTGRSIGTITNISPAINYGTNLGVITGGELYSNSASLVLTVSAGQGYLMQTTSGIDDLKLISWATTQTILIPNKDNYVYMDSNGLPNVSLSASSQTYTIPLGKARSTTIPANGVLYLQEIQQDASHTATKLSNILELSLGPVYVSGSITSQNGVTPSDLLNVTSGEYTFGDRIFLPVGATPISWQAYLGAGTNSFVTTQTTVDFKQWDNGGVLSPIPANYYATHLLYVIGGFDSDTDRITQTYALVYSQTVYSTLPAAEVGDLPTAPTSWTGNIVPIALVIVKNNSATRIAEILDERPRPGFVASSIAGVTVHGNLLGLLADDHPQYVLTNGGRLMTGDLQMGGNNITFTSPTSTVDGVVVHQHGARHGANNLDPIPAGVVGDIQSIGITGAAGVNNAFARADHVHAHGSLPGDGLHAVADISTAGFMSATDKQMLVHATPSNTPSTLVLRDANGNFAAGIITAALVGNVTGNVDGTVTGGLVGNVTGNVHGNVVGNVLGDVTGNVVGNVSGAASANVLKVGDTMTGELRISDPTLSPLVITGNVTTPAALITGQSLTAAPALRLEGNPASNGSDVILAIDASGNVTKSTVAISGLGNSGTSGNMSNTLVLRDANGNFAAGTITAGLRGNVTGNVSGTVTGGLEGDVTGNVYGNVQGNLHGNVLGDVTGNVVGNVSGAASANVLKVGDTMTGELRISDPTSSPLVVTGNATTPAALITGQSLTAAPALRLEGNPASNGSDVILAIDASGNVTKSTVVISGLGNSGTSGNMSNTLVLRDANGNFAAGIITAALVGNVTGNLGGIVTGGLVGNVTGNVHGNVVGNVFGDVTGNVVGNVSGAASANVLKTGDTMTGELRISDATLSPLVVTGNATTPATLITGQSTTTASALRLAGNPASAGSDVILAIDALGNVTKSTVAISGLGNSGTSGNVANTLVLRDANTNFAAGIITAALVGNVTGNVGGIVTGGLVGNVTGNVHGNVVGNVFGDVTGNVVGNVSGAASANVLKTGDTMTGELHISDATLSPLVVTGNATTPATLITGQSTTTASALRLAGNPASAGSDVILAIDALGNVTKSTVAISGLGNSGTSGNVANTLVLRDANTNFAAGIITAALVGNVTGNVGGIVTGGLVGNVTGNVHGNVVGNLFGDVVGNVSGAASVNVLKVGDTMTGELRISDGTLSALVLSKNTTAPTEVITGNSTTQAPALQLLGNPTATSNSYFLTIDSSGDVMQSTATIGSLTTATSGNQAGTLVLRDANGNFAADIITAALVGNVTGNVAGNVFGNVTGNVVGNVSGAASANVLKVGDTMTGELRISDATLSPLVVTGNATTPATVITGQSTTTAGVLRLVNIPTIGTTDSALAVDAGGNVTKSNIVTINSAGDVTLGAGTAALPSVNFSGSQTTGLSAQTADTLVLSTAGTSRVSVGATGAVTVSVPTANVVGVSVTGNTVGSSSAVSITQGNNAASGTALAVVAATNAASNPAVALTGAVNAADIMTITGAAGAGATGRGLFIDKSQASASGVGLQVNSNTASPAVLITGQSTTTAGVLRLANMPTTGTTDNVLAVDAGGNVTKSSIVTVNSVGAVTYGTGTAALPSMTFNGNTNTGIYSPTTNQVAVTTNGAQRVIVDDVGATTINAPTANSVGLTVTGNTAGSSSAVSVAQGNNAVSGSALLVTAATNAASNPAVVVNGAANAANIMTISGAASATGDGLVIDKSQAGASGEGLAVTGNTNNPAALLTGNGTTQAPALRMAGIPSLPLPSLTFNTTGYALVSDVAGNVMTSLGNNGNSLRTFFSQPNWFEPIELQREVFLWDDFCGNMNQLYNGLLRYADTIWSAVTSGGGTVNAPPAVTSANDFGVAQLQTTNNGDVIILCKQQNCSVFGVGSCVAEARVSVATLSATGQTYIVRIGFGDTTSNADNVDGVYFEYNQATTGNFWVCKTANNSTRTSTTTSTPVAAGTYYRLRIEVNAAGTQALFYINGILVATITTNIPVTPGTRVCGPTIQMYKNAGTTARQMNVDYWMHHFILTTLR